MASKFVGVGFGRALRASLPIYVIFFVTIATAIFFPELILWLPKHLFPESVGCFKGADGVHYICPG
jgi:TRAP-type C4-dicarboxylate transport system permease large subunit